MSKSARVLEWVTTGRVSFLKDSWRILTAALTALIVVYVLRLWAIGFGLGLVNLLGPLDAQVGNLLGRLGTHLLGAYLVTANPLIRSANPSVGLSPAYTTSPAPFHTTLGNSASIAGSVVG